MNLPRIRALLLALSATAAQANGGPELAFDGTLQAATGVPVFVSLELTTNGNAISGIAVSLDIDLDGLAFDPGDQDGDGVPDSVVFPLGTPELFHINFDAGDLDGELDLLLANISGLPFLDGVLLEIQLLPTSDGVIFHRLLCSQAPPASFGDANGQDVPGTCVIKGAEIFADSFESGDVSAWTMSNP